MNSSMKTFSLLLKFLTVDCNSDMKGSGFGTRRVIQSYVQDTMY